MTVFVTVDLKTGRGHLVIIGTYTPEEGKTEDSKEFYKVLQDTYIQLNSNHYINIAGDLNARVGNVPIPNIIGTEGEPTINDNGGELRKFAGFSNIKIANTFFRKRKLNKHTWAACGQRSVID